MVYKVQPVLYAVNDEHKSTIRFEHNMEIGVWLKLSCSFFRFQYFFKDTLVQ